MGIDRINLLPKDLQRGNEAVLQKALIATWIATIAVLMVIHVFQSRKGSQKLNQLEAVKREVQSMAVAIEKASTDAKAAEQATRKVQSAKEIIKGRMRWTEMLKELSLLAPDSLWLTGLATKTDKEGYIEITGQAPKQEAIANYLAALENSYYFRRSVLKMSDKLADVTPDLYQFVLETKIPQLQERAKAIASKAKVDHDKKP